MIQIIYHRDKCIGCNSCSDLSPYRWNINEQDGKSNLVGSVLRKNIYVLQTSDDEMEDCMNASDNCPVNIIEVKCY
jgi:ferredoxin